LVVIPPEAGSERPLSGGVPRQAAAGPLRYGALKVPLLQSRLARLPSRFGAPAPSSIWRALPRAAAAVGAGVLALILAGGLAHYRFVEPSDPLQAVDSIEAWLRHMTVTRALPPSPPPLDWPEGL
jgi:hypothetical protein